MNKQKTSFFCQSCGASSAKWVGKCPSCMEWNTYVEEVVIKKSPENPVWKEDINVKPVPQLVQNVLSENFDRIPTKDEELDRVLGGGIVGGSLVLIGGEPGIGKSTLMLQVAIQLTQLKILYVSGEESPHQIKMRADRIGVYSKKCYLLSETDLYRIFQQAKKLTPNLLIIDSIQTIHSQHIESAPGSVSQVKDCTGQLLKYAKESNIPVFLIGHINKEGSIAGPKVLEHMVDTVLQFEGDRNHVYRILRTIKNRFGSTFELGIYQMRHEGLVQVKNPSEILLSDQSVDRSGVAIGASMEGNRPLMVEVQALVSPANYGTPQRTATGFDLKRLHMLLAVLEKRMNLKMGVQDVFLNITGGIRVDDPSIDMAVCAAIYSSYHDLVIPRQVCFVGEIGLGGEVRMVNRFESRVKEAEKLGFSEIFLANKDLANKEKDKVMLNNVKLLRDVFSHLFD
jgi:DNA repair protein RadA/Sms